MKFCKKYLVKKELVISYLNHLAYLKLKKNLRKKGKESVASATEDLSDPDSNEEDEDDQAMGESIDDNDLIMNLVEGSDASDSEEDDKLTFVPPLRTITRHGRLAGTWQRNFQIVGDNSSDESTEEKDNRYTKNKQKPGENLEDEEDEVEKESDIENENENELNDETIHITRSGRKAGTWRRFIK